MQSLMKHDRRIAYVFTDYYDRKGRARFINQHFRTYLERAQTVLDIGCDDNRLKPTWGSKVTGIDIGGTPDYIVDLEKEKLSRFPDRSFDLLICTDVLEHIDNLYAVLDDMIRVSNGRIIISLPNCAHIFRILPVVFGRSSGKFYGLPLDPPPDRHKWFFNWKELQAFFHRYAERKGLKIESEFLSYGYRSVLRRSLLHTAAFIVPITTFAQGYWVVLARTSASLSNQLTQSKKK